MQLLNNALNFMIGPISNVHYPKSTHLRIAVVIGFLSGLTELIILGVNKLIFQRFVFVGVDAIWMIPLTNMFFFSFFCIFLLIFYHIFPKVASINFSILLFSILGYFILLSVSARYIFKGALLLLAIGLAKQTVEIINNDRLQSKLVNIGFRNNHSQANYNKRIILFLALAVVFLFSVVRLSLLFKEMHQLAALPDIQSDSPNVILIVLDTVRAESLSLYGYDEPTTPNLSEIAKSGVLFTHAYTTSPWTLPAHASIFTGQFPSKLSANFENPLDDTYPTISEILSNSGYLTAGFVANKTYCSYETGLNRGFIHYEDYDISIGEALNSSELFKWIVHSKLRHWYGDYQLPGRKTAEQVNKSVIKWLKQRERDRPFFIFINYYDAHDPYIVPENVAQTFELENSLNRLKGLGASYTAQELSELKKSYESSIFYLDHQLGKFFGELKLLDLGNTLIIITSDHGEQFGAHGLVSHANSLYTQLLHVPLIILSPEFTGNSQVDEVVSLIDLPNTILDYVGLDSPPTFSGTSLAMYWDQAHLGGSREKFALSEAEPGEGQPIWYPTSKGPMISLIKDEYHYIIDGNCNEELYRLKVDQKEVQNIIDDIDDMVLYEFYGELKNLESVKQHGLTNSTICAE